jgi:hypothetical protein
MRRRLSIRKVQLRTVSRTGLASTVAGLSRNVAERTLATYNKPRGVYESFIGRVDCRSNITLSRINFFPTGERARAVLISSDAWGMVNAIAGGWGPETDTVASVTQRVHRRATWPA